MSIGSLWRKGLKDFLGLSFLPQHPVRQGMPDTERYCKERLLWGTEVLVWWQSTLPKVLLPPKFIIRAAGQQNKLQ